MNEYEHSSVVLVIAGALDCAAVSSLFERLCAELEGNDADFVICDVRALSDADVGAVDALARLQLAAHRIGRSIRLRAASEELLGLLVLVGLSDVLPSQDERA